MYIAHIRQNKQDVQLLRDHLLETKLLAETIGERLNLKYLCGISALLHDLGKYSNTFQTYLRKAVYDPENAPKRGSVDHSTAGGKLLYERYHKHSKNPFHVMTAEIIGNAIISHHSSLHDFLNDELESPYLKRVRDKSIEEFGLLEHRFFEEVLSQQELDAYFYQAVSEIQQLVSKLQTNSVPTQLYFLSRFVFSALIQADRTNTRIFEEGREEESTGASLLQNYTDTLENYLQVLQQTAPETAINQLRQQMSMQCKEAASLPSDTYTLSIPTGGGKTLASLRYALHHAGLHNKKRIIYVVPFTTIIEQNALEVTRILEDPLHIVQHHSNVVDEQQDDEFVEGSHSTLEKVKLARDTWEAPLIFTTMVQYLETCYGHGSRTARRFHNLCEAIVIFDEVQKVPTKSVELFNQSVNFLKSTGSSSMLLCTATQPALEFVERRLDISAENEIISNLHDVEQAFKRTELVDKTAEGPLSTSQLVELALHYQRLEQNVLVILNTKSVVKKLYIALTEREPELQCYHLSTSMCPAHRQQELTKVKQALKKGHPFICVTTQLIEAGVDVDFNCVIRSLAGLDSIAQAAGRCNRHGKNPMKQVILIKHAEETVTRLDDIAKGQQISEGIVAAFRKDPRLFGGNLLSQKAMSRYFKEFYTAQASQLSYPLAKLGTSMAEVLFSAPSTHPFAQQLNYRLHRRPETILTTSFRLASQAYTVIDSSAKNVVVPFDSQARELIADLGSEKTVRELGDVFKKAQSYTVSIFDNEFHQLVKQGLVHSYLDGLVFAVNEVVYSKHFGVDVTGDGVTTSDYFY